MLEARPGAYINIGNGDTAGSCPVHNPGYDFNDAAIPYGAGILAGGGREGIAGRGLITASGAAAGFPAVAGTPR